MSNHIHVILVLEGDAAGASPRPTIMDALCAYKSLTTRECKKLGMTEKLFQTSFYNNDCMWYKEKQAHSDIIYMSEMEKIRNTLFNRMISDNVLDNQRIVMALVILFNTQEQDLFLHDPNNWREAHSKLGLNNDDLQYVISFVIRHHSSFNT